MAVTQRHQPCTSRFRPRGNRTHTGVSGRETDSRRWCANAFWFSGRSTVQDKGGSSAFISSGLQWVFAIATSSWYQRSRPVTQSIGARPAHHQHVPHFCARLFRDGDGLVRILKGMGRPAHAVRSDDEISSRQASRESGKSRQTPPSELPLCERRPAWRRPFGIIGI